MAVNQRVRLGAPLGDRTDLYMENIIKNRTVPCMIFQFTAGITGIVLVLLRGRGLDALITNPAIGLKGAILVFVMGLISYVHFNLQPKIDDLFAKAESNPMPAELAQSIGRLRKRRTRLATTCLLCVLIISLLALQVWATFPLWLNGVLVAAIVVFTWRTYNSFMKYGWW
jgi:hypothetical protein